MSHTYYAEKPGREYFVKASVDQLIGDLQNPHIRDALDATIVPAEALGAFAAQAFVPDVSPEGVISIAEPEQGLPIIALRQGEVFCRDTSFTTFTNHQYAIRPSHQDMLAKAAVRAHHSTPEHDFSVSLSPVHMGGVAIACMAYVEASQAPLHSYDYFTFRPLALLTYRDSNFGPTSSAEMAYLAAKALYISDHPHLRSELPASYDLAMKQADEEAQRIAHIFKDELGY